MKRQRTYFNNTSLRPVSIDDVYCMKVHKSENKIPISISSKRKMSRIAISVDGASSFIMEFAPSNTIPWMIGNFRFESDLDFHVFGARGGKIVDSDLEVEWLTIP